MREVGSLSRVGFCCPHVSWCSREAVRLASKHHDEREEARSHAGQSGGCEFGAGAGGGKVGSLAVGVWLLALSSSEIWLR